MTRSEKALKDSIEKLIPEIPDFRDIPKIDLYMEQVTTFLDGALSGMKRNKKDKIFTKTMINNYTKDGVIAPPRKKKYGPDHMMTLVYIYFMKQSLSIHDISDVLKLLPKNMPDQELYELYGNIISSYTDGLMVKLTNEYERVKKITQDDDEKCLMMLITQLATEAAINKMLATTLLDKYKEILDENSKEKQTK